MYVVRKLKAKAARILAVPWRALKIKLGFEQKEFRLID